MVKAKSAGYLMLYVLFLLSGISGLIYETVWLRMLIRVLGSTVYATSIVLAAFMAGLSLGSYLIGRWASRSRNQLRLYAFLEIGVALAVLGFTLVFAHLLPLYRMVYDMGHGDRFVLTLFQAGLLFVLLLVPTALMGGTLPVLSSYTRVHGVAFTPRVAILYGLNTLGAVVGVLGSGILWIGAWGETSTLAMGLGITTLVAALAYVLSRQAAPEAAAATSKTAPASEVISPYPDRTRRLVGVAYALSGFVAMAYEIIWTRMFQIDVGTSIYAFSIMLGFYLAGVGLGSLLGGRLLGRVKNPLRVFGFLQLGIALYGLAGMYIFTIFDPLSLTMQLTLGNVLVMPLLIVLPITFVLGVMFPTVSRSYVHSESEVSRAIGRLYSLNTLGCIAGSLVCGFFLVRFMGTRGTMLLLAGLNLAIGLAVLYAEPGVSWRRWLPAAGVFVAASFLVGWKAPDPFKVAVDRAILKYVGPAALDNVELYYHKESLSATTTAFGIRNQPLNKHLWVNGIGMTVLCMETKIMAHLPLMLVDKPEDMLVVCFGMGTTTRSAWVHKDLKIDVVELDPETYECYKYFHADGPAILADPRVRHFADDGRNYVLMCDKKYDVITMDPAPPVWSAGTVNLYTKEFFSLCKDRLKPGGLMCLWVPPMEASEEMMIMRTYQEVFPQTYVWRAPNGPAPGYYLTGLKDRDTIDLLRPLQAAEDPAVLKDLNEWAPADRPFVTRSSEILTLLVLKPEELRAFVAAAPVITDDHPYTEFPLWRSLNDRLYKSHIVLARKPGGDLTLGILDEADLVRPK